MSNMYFTEGRMESQFLATDNVSVIFQSAGANAAVSDGTLAVLGGFYNDPVYTSAFGANRVDMNTRIATLPASATDAGVGVISLVDVPTASGLGNTYRIGAPETIGITKEAGKPVRFRKFQVDDTFFTGSDNCTAALTVGQYAIVDTTGKWAPSATVPTSGLYAKVISTEKVSRGVTADITEYFLQIARLA